MPNIKSKSSVQERWAVATFWLWLLAWFTPSLAGAPGWQLALIAVLEGWHEPKLGAWAVFANLTIPVALAYVLSGQRPTRLLAWTVALPGTSPGYWLLIRHFDAEGVGVFIWTASIICLVIACALTAPSPTEPPPRGGPTALDAEQAGA